MRKITVVCPICGKWRKMDIPPEIFDVDQGFLLKLPIYSNDICQHRFVAVLDYNFAVRDYETPPPSEFEQKFGSGKKPAAADFSYF